MSAATFKVDDAILAKGAVINFLGNIGRLSRALALLLMARLFGPETLGHYLLAWAFVDFIGKSATFGQEMSVVRFVAHAIADGDEDRATRIIGSSLVIILVTGALFALGVRIVAPTVAGLLSGAALVLPLNIMAFAVIPHALRGVLLAATKARKVMQYDVLVRSFIEPFGLLAGTFLAWKMGTGIAGLAMAQTAALWLAAFASLLCYARLYSTSALVRAVVRPSELGTLTRYGLPVAGRDMMSHGVSRTDLFMVGHFLGAAMSGIYGIVQEFAYLIRDVRQALEPILAPMASEQHHLGQLDRLQNTYTKATRWALTVNIAYLGIAVLSGGTLLQLYRGEFFAGSAALSILVGGQVIYGAFGLSETMLLMIGHPGLMFVNMSIMVVLIAGLNYVFIPIWGITGAATATTSAMLLIACVQVAQVRWFADVHPFQRSLLKPTAAFFVALAVAWVIPLGWLPTAGADVVRAVVFLLGHLAVLITLGLEEDERAVARSMKNYLIRMFRRSE
jgi:O-antigen/teichoic acid export membrane protein